MKKVLIISYYWPPSGGAGVQRWLKLSKYLSRAEVEVHILTVDTSYASYPVHDDSLERDVASNILVHRTKARNYFKFYEKLVGKKNVPKSGYSNVNAQKFSQRLISSVRSHLFIPDPRKGWNAYALKKAMELINEFGIHNVVTTSPPHSTQLIGLELKKRFAGINWIVDFRDPWTDIYYYKLLGHSKYSNSMDKMYEKNVLEKSDLIVTVSNGFKQIFLSKNNVQIDEQKIEVLTNGFDKEDFKVDNSVKTKQSKFEIIYTGTIAEQYAPQVFFKAYKRLSEEFPSSVSFKIVGAISPSIKEYAASIGVVFEYIPHVPHDKVVEYQQNADVLLLIIPDVPKSDGIIPGKLFEYLASRNPIIVIGPEYGDVHEIVRETEAGNTFNRYQETEIYAFLKLLLEKHINNESTLIPEDKISKYERSAQAKEFSKLLK